MLDPMRNEYLLLQDLSCVYLVLSISIVVCNIPVTEATFPSYRSLEYHHTQSGWERPVCDHQIFIQLSMSSQTPVSLVLCIAEISTNQTDCDTVSVKSFHYTPLCSVQAVTACQALCRGCRWKELTDQTNYHFYNHLLQD